MNTSGFYKNDSGTLLYAPLFVQASGFLLLRQDREEYTYPTEGWQWFDSKGEAIDAYGIIPPENEVEVAASFITPKWGSWRKEMSRLPSFQLLFQLIDQNGQGAAWAYLLNLLFQVAQDESIIPEIVTIWQQISNDAGIHQGTKDHWAGIAEKHDLPTDFIQAIRS